VRSSAASPAATAVAATATAPAGTASWADTTATGEDTWGTGDDAGGWGASADAGAWAAGDRGGWGAEAGDAPAEPPPSATKGMFGGIMEATQAAARMHSTSSIATQAAARAAEPQFPCRKLVAYDDPLDSAAADGSNQDAKIKALYEKYLASELGQEDAAALPSSLGAGGVDSDDEEGAGGSERDAGPGAGMFHKALKASPQQIMRYAFEGGPVLPKGYVLEAPPPCAGCGGPRTFEVQLMPALLEALDVDASATVSGVLPGGLLGDVVVGEAEGGGATAAAAAATDEVDTDAEDSGSDENDTKPGTAAGALSHFAVVGGGMDWGSVLVYSCVASCGTTADELVRVLPASAV